MSSNDQPISRDQEDSEPQTVASTGTEPGDSAAPVASEPRGVHRLIALSSENSFRIGLVGTLGVLTALVIGGAISNSIVILTYTGAALFLAMGLEPIVHKLVSWHFPRALAITTVFVGFLLIVTVMIMLIVPTAISEGEQLAEQAPAFINDLTKTAWFEALNTQFQGSFDDIVTSVTAFLRDPSQWMAIAGGVFSVGASIVGGVFAVVTVTILMLYFMASMDAIQRASSLLLPASRRDRFNDLVSRMRKNVGAFVISQVVIALINAVAGYIVMTIFQVRFASILAPLVFLLALIPMIGSILATVLVVAVAFLTSPLTALIMGIYYVVYMQVEAYVITPHVVRRAVPIPAIVVVLSALLGGSLMGILGALIAIPIAASVIMIIQELWIPRQNQR